MKNKIIVKDWGVIDFAEAWNSQSILQQELIEKKRTRKSNNIKAETGEHYLVFCQHHHVYTLGKSGDEGHLLADAAGLKKRQATFYKINRGGDITYHGPGQWVVYPILDMELIYTDIHRYIRELEEVVILVCADYGVTAYRLPEFTGVWVGDQPRRKICAIGVHLSRWVSMHGLAFNINTDLSYFSDIVPCGIQDDNKEVTSLAAEIKRPLDMEEVKGKILKHFQNVFEFDEQSNRD